MEDNSEKLVDASVQQQEPADDSPHDDDQDRDDMVESPAESPEDDKLTSENQESPVQKVVADADVHNKELEDKSDEDDTHVENHPDSADPQSVDMKAENGNGSEIKTEIYDTEMDEGEGSGSEEEQGGFMRMLENFCRENSLEFKPPKFYGEPLNCLKLWRAVTQLGGYDRVTANKLWRQVGETFRPPKTCTTVSWTFRIFYEKSLLEYEKHKRQSGELHFPDITSAEPLMIADVETTSYKTPGSASGQGRARRDSAARAMQGWHSQRHYGYGEDKNVNPATKREKQLKSVGVNTVLMKQKKAPNLEHVEKAIEKAIRSEADKQLVATVVDLGTPADWVKINVRETNDCFEVYALVPGLLREEVRVQSDPAGRLVITGQPEQLDNPWGITAFKKVVNLPGRIDPLQTSAVVSLHGRLFVRVPFEQTSFGR